MLRLSFFTLLLTITACGAPQGHRREIEELAQGSNAVSVSGSAYHSLRGWAKPVLFYVESNAPSEVQEAAVNAAGTWADAVGREVMIFKGTGSSTRGNDLYSSLDDNRTFIYYESNWTSSTKKAETTLATTIWENAEDTDAIVKGDVILNAQTYTFVDANNVPNDVDESRVVDSETVLLHEFGHLLGLEHISEDVDSDSIMHAKTFIGPGLTFRHPSNGDMSNMQGLYK